MTSSHSGQQDAAMWSDFIITEQEPISSCALNYINALTCSAELAAFESWATEKANYRGKIQMRNIPQFSKSLQFLSSYKLILCFLSATLCADCRQRCLMNKLRPFVVWDSWQGSLVNMLFCCRSHPLKFGWTRTGSKRSTNKTHFRPCARRSQET